MNAQELKDFQEKDRQVKDRQAKAEQEKKDYQEKADKAKEEYQKASQKRYEYMTKKHEDGSKRQEEQRKKEERQAAKARRPHSDLGKAREKLRKSPEHEQMRKAIKEQVKDRQATAEAGKGGPHIVRGQEEQADVQKYGQMQADDRKMALGEAGKGHASPELQGMRGGREMEAEQAKAAYRAAGEQKPWEKHAEKQQEQKNVTHEKRQDRNDGPQANAIRADRNGPDKPGPAPAHHGLHMPWDKNPGQEKGGHGHHLSKESGQELQQGKPWERQQHADPDRAEARMTEQSRAKEREEQSR